MTPEVTCADVGGFVTVDGGRVLGWAAPLCPLIGVWHLGGVAPGTSQAQVHTPVGVNLVIVPLHLTAPMADLKHKSG